MEGHTTDIQTQNNQFHLPRPLAAGACIFFSLAVKATFTCVKNK